jgi:hypothetical protein
MERKPRMGLEILSASPSRHRVVDATLPAPDRDRVRRDANSRRAKPCRIIADLRPGGGLSATGPKC